MKKIFIAYLLLFSVLWAGSLSSTEITEMISKIKEERVGISIEKLENTVNPFRMVKIKQEENLTKEEPIMIQAVIIEPTYSLDAILNHAAFINKKWYKKGSKIDQYRVTYIGKRTVRLKNSEKEKTLSLRKKKYIKLH